MTATEKYTFLRQAGFSHDEAFKFINKGEKPNLNTDMKRVAFERLQGKEKSHATTK